MRTTKIIFWCSTIIIFLFQGVMPALTSHTEMAKEGMAHLGYPAYFGMILAFFKVAGSLALIIPKIPERLKEWAYAGLTFDFVGAFISLLVVDGAKMSSFFPLLILAILMLSYRSHHRMRTAKETAENKASSLA